MTLVNKARLRLLIAIAVYAGALGIALLRAGVLTSFGELDVSARWVAVDYYTAGYYPARALLDGENPHNREVFLSKYPVPDTYPPYSAVNLVLHIPLALLPHVPAGAIYFLLSALLTLPLAYVALRLAGVHPAPHTVGLMAAGVLLSRPGHWTLLLGQGAILLTLASYLAFRYGRTSPALAGAALTVATFKPTFGLPLAVLMLAWGRWRAVAIGVGLVAVVSLPIYGFLAGFEGGVAAFIEVFRESYHGWHDQPHVAPESSHNRVDAVSFVSRLMGTSLSDLQQIVLSLAILGAASAVVYLLSSLDTQDARNLAVGLICLATSLVGFHRGYDLVLLAAPMVAVAVRGLPALTSARARIVLVSLFAVPALNWVVTESALAVLSPSRPVWLLITSANSACLVALFGLFLWSGLRLGIQARVPPRQTVGAAHAS